MDLTVVANKIVIINKQAFMEEIKIRCIDNDFREIKFLYDILQCNIRK